MRKTLTILILSCLATGCGTILRNGAHDKDMRFAATRCDAHLIEEYWQPSGNGSWNPVTGVWFLTPISLVDIPFAIVLDSILFPFDAYDYGQAMKAERYWKDALRTGTISAADAPHYLTRHTRDQIRWALESDRGNIATNVIDVIFDLAVTNQMPDVLVALSKRPRLSAEQCRTLYAWQQSRPSGHGRDILYNLARNPATPMDTLTALAAFPDEYVRIETIQTGRLPLPLVTNEIARLATSSSWASRRFVAAYPATPPHTLAQLADTDQRSVQEAVASNTNTPEATLRALSLSKYKETRAAIAANPLTPLDVILSLSDDKEGSVRAAIAGNPITPVATLIKYSSDKYYDELRNLARNPNTPREVLITLTTNYYVYIKSEARMALKKMDGQNKPSDRTR